MHLDLHLDLDIMGIIGYGDKKTVRLLRIIWSLKSGDRVMGLKKKSNKGKGKKSIQSRIEPTYAGVLADGTALVRDVLAGDVGLFERETRRRARNLVVDDGLVRLRASGMPDELLGFLVKSLHFHTPFYFLLFFWLLPRKIAPIVMLPLVACLVAFFYFDGCFLTIIEYRLTGRDINIIDPYIYGCVGVSPTPSDRFYYTLGLTSVYFAAVTAMTALRLR